LKGVEVKRILILFVLAMGFMAIMGGCTKYKSPVAPDLNPPDTTATSGQLSIKTVDEADLPLDGVAVYKKNWNDSLEAWPAKGRNITADGGTIGFNAIVTGSQVFVGKKDGYLDGTSTVEIEPDGSETVFLVLHKKAVSPDTTTPPPDNRGPQGCFGMRSDGVNLFLNGSVWGKAIEGKYGTLIFNGTTFPMDTVYLADLSYISGEYVLPLVTLAHHYTRYTMVFGAIVNNQWYYAGRTGCEPTLDGVWKDAEDPNWFGFRWDEIQPPPPITKYWLEVRTNVANPTVKYDGQLWNLGISQITAGHHTVEVSKTDYVTKSVEFEAVGNDTVVVVANLSPVQPNLDSWVDLTVTSPTDVIVTLDGVLWGTGKKWVEAGKQHVLRVTRSGYTSWEATFTNAPGETKSYTVTLNPVTPPPVTNPLRVEFSGNTMRLYGNGRENWLGLECYDPDQNETTGWLVNRWVKGVVRSDHIEFTISDARYDHVVIWHDATSGLQGSGGSGISPRFINYQNLQKGTGIKSINITPGYLVLER